MKKTSQINNQLHKNTAQNSLVDYNYILHTNSENKFLYALINNLKKSTHFKIIIAFITKSGISVLKQTLIELEKNNISGEIITGTYLNFTQPDALNDLASFSNISLRVVKDKELHAKAFIFGNGNNNQVIVGSSNLTKSALLSNTEWNLEITTQTDNKLFNYFLTEFETIKRETVEWKDYSTEYTKIYKQAQLKSKQESNADVFNEYQKAIKPNQMQNNALLNLMKLRQENKNKALIISATGTGKTYLAAFDVQNFDPKRVLFIVHQNKIAKDALKTFKNVMPDKEYGLYNGQQKDTADFTFSTIQTISKHYENFDPKHFDYLIIDETHHVGGNTYQKILNYFKPQFLLGMTATPERSDDYNVFADFDNNIAIETRLNTALENSYLSPFHYFGVTDITLIDQKLDDINDIRMLTTDQRVKHIVQQAKLYGHSGDTLHGLIFLSSVEEANIVCQKMNQDYGIKVEVIDGKTSETDRDKAIEMLEKGELNYIISVNVLNEGIDIPCVNQIIMARPTKSAIIFIQQLGRGLRKSSEKEYLTVIDLIGNHSSNWQIALGLSPKKNYVKKDLIDLIDQEVSLIGGESLIQMDQISKEKIISQVSKENFGQLKYIKDNYILLKNKLNRIPLLNDFLEQEMISPFIVSGYKKSYPLLLQTIFEKNEFSFDEINLKFAEFLNEIFRPAPRYEELIIAKLLIENKQVTIADVLKYCSKENITTSQKSINSAFDLFLGNKYRGYSTLNKYYKENFILNNQGIIKLNFELDPKIVQFHQDLIKININNLASKNVKNITGKPVVGNTYSKFQAYQMNNMDYNNGVQVAGYGIDKEKKNVCVFIALSSQYSNKVLNSTDITYDSMEGRLYTEDKPDKTETIIGNNSASVHVFAQTSLKNEVETQKFIYLGKVKEVLKVEQALKPIKCTKFTIRLENPIDNIREIKR